MSASATGVRQRRRGDRFDGRLLRSLDPFYRITPYLMRTRADAQDLFEDRVDVGPAEAWLRLQRRAGRGGLGFLHLFVAAYVRTVSQRPYLNRFVAGRRIYARHELLVSLAVKPRLRVASPETVVKVRLDPAATVFEVAAALDEAVAAARAPTPGETDRTARRLMRLPGLALRAAMALLRALDALGRLPRALHRASPFHTSVFVTDLGSLGIEPIYHHLYEFGTTSVFLAFGAKRRERVLDAAGRVVVRTTIGLKVVNDERICDGHAYARAFKDLLGLLTHPERLERPPARVVEDVE